MFFPTSPLHFDSHETLAAPGPSPGRAQFSQFSFHDATSADDVRQARERSEVGQAFAGGPEQPTSTIQCLLCSFPRERTPGKNELVLKNAEPFQTDVFAHARQGDGTIRAAPPFLALATSDHFHKKGIARRRADAV